MRSPSALQGDCDTGDMGVWSNSVYNPERLKFFDRWLKNKANNINEKKAVRLYVMGCGDGDLTVSGNLNHGGKWRYEDDWPPRNQVKEIYYLKDNGFLDNQSASETTSNLSYIYDPSNPVPTVGGPLVGMFEIKQPDSGGPDPNVVPNHLDQWAFVKNYIQEVIPAGGFHQKETAEIFGAKAPYKLLKDRNDVLTFETSPMKEAIEITGVIEVEIFVSSDAPDTDVTVKILDIYPYSKDFPDGYHLNLTDTIFRMRYREGYDREVNMVKNDVYKVRINLWPTSNLFKKGHKLMLDISSSNFPRFDLNPNTGQAMGKHTSLIKATNTVWTGGDYPSKIKIPVVKNL